MQLESTRYFYKFRFLTFLFVLGARVPPSGHWVKLIVIVAKLDCASESPMQSFSITDFQSPLNLQNQNFWRSICGMLFFESSVCDLNAPPRVDYPCYFCMNRTTVFPSHLQGIGSVDPPRIPNPRMLKSLIKTGLGTSLVAQWLRTRLPMQGTRVQALVREDPTCRGATKPVSHNYWACALEPASHNYWAHVPQLLKPAL